MNANGILIYTRAYAAASTAGAPAAIALQIGKGLKGKSLEIYKGTGKVNQGQLDFSTLVAAQRGLYFKDYNESTGILFLDAAVCGATVTTYDIVYADITTQTSGYLVINASKNPALTGMSIPRTGTLLRITGFTASGTWTKSDDVGSIVVKMVGGGGAGGTGTSTAGGGGAGGGGGGYSEKLIVRGALADSETVTIGAASGTTSFGAHASASGGSTGGATNAGGGAGGVGSGGSVNFRGQGGAGGSNAGTGGNGGSSQLGGGAAGDGSGVGTAAGANTGGGGSGGFSGAGGAGGTGYLFVYEYSI